MAKSGRTIKRYGVMGNASQAKSSPGLSRNSPSGHVDFRHAATFSRHDASEFCQAMPPNEIRGRGECRVPNAPAASCALWGSEYAHEYSQRRHRKHPAFPTQWFYGLYVISPGTGLFCPRHFRGIVSRENLAPASGRQDHTTSPSAAAPLVLRRIRVHRIPPRVRDDAYAPLVEAGRRGEYTISDFRKDKYFCTGGWTGESKNDPSGKSLGICNTSRHHPRLRAIQQ